VPEVTVPRISVVICAYTEQRWDQILAAVDSVRGQSLTCGEIIVVVDHNPDLLTHLAAALPDVTVVANREVRGLSGARNTGIAQAHGDIVAFLDDDAIAEPHWLKFLADPYTNPAVVGVGGLVLPEWETQRPFWFPKEFDWVVGCSYVGLPHSQAPVRNLMGGASSFKRDVFDLVGGFRNGIGRSDETLPLGCEETELCIRLSQRIPGSVLLFDNRAVIRHFVPADRCRYSYFLSRCFAEGLSKAAVAAVVGTGDGLSAERRYSIRVLPKGVARDVAALLRGDSAGLGRACAIITGLTAATAGYTLGALRGSARGRLRRKHGALPRSRDNG
jgi:glycosyltransferase involved in cell wall biosynthesis